MSISLSNLRSKVKRRRIKTVGRGTGSGHGAYSGRGIKGQHARGRGSHVPGFEGGRTTIIMQTPKRRGKGFRSLRPEFDAVWLSDLNSFKDGEVVSQKTLRSQGLVSRRPAKIVGSGELQRKLDVRVPATAGAREAILKAGGKALESAATEKPE